jgi:mono/diheme cytochrome c family protein
MRAQTRTAGCAHKAHLAAVPRIDLFQSPFKTLLIAIGTSLISFFPWLPASTKRSTNPHAAPCENISVTSRSLLFVLLSIAPASPLFAASTDADEKAGAILFRDKGCEHCHGVGGIGTKKAPPLTSIRTDKAWPPEKITKQILNGGPKMPPFADSLSDPEVAQIVAYLRARHRPIPPPASGN